MANYTSWRTHRFPKPNFMNGDPAEVPATKFFDQLSFIGDEGTACFLLETSAGLVLIDCLWPNDRSVDIIERGIRDLGHDPKDLAAIVISHGHGDHYGKAGQFREKYGCKLYLEESDYHMACQPSDKPFPPIDYPMDGYLTDMGTLTFGDTTITCVLTPGHTPGCMSFIFPVTDDGEPHTVALWGGTGLLPESDPVAYMDSVIKFRKVCDDMGADCEVSNHPFVDNMVPRLQVIRQICDGVGNPFVIGMEARHRYEDMFYRMGDEAAKARGLK